ncbi:hypothetical protein JAB1_01150 [Janthinobacterium sp. MP5059B]|nr:hypothetical protein JAB1_01150 [Janthinobacterium sp. MP5059B]
MNFRKSQKEKMLNYKLSNFKFEKTFIKLFSFFLGVLASGLALSTTMEVSPSNPKAKIKETIQVEIKFKGKVEKITDRYEICPRTKPVCPILRKSITISDQNKVLIGYFNGVVTCTDGYIITVRGVNYEACRDPVIKVALPAKNSVGAYTYIATHPLDMFADDMSTTFTVKVGSNDAISEILPIILD